MKILFTLCLFLLFVYQVFAQRPVEGRIIDANDQQPIPGAAIKILRTGKVTVANKEGMFSVPVSGDTTLLEIDAFGYVSRKVKASLFLKMPVLELTGSPGQLSEVVVSTGYQVLPKERATGSFTQLNNKVLNQQVSTDILSRLEGVANGVSEDRSTSGSNNRISIRGLSTIQGPKDPLVVIDNFIYDGDIININPNDVESISILKDAAASSIWGARAGNGVIVITTKKAKFNQPVSVDFNSNISLTGKPDLNYIRQMSSSDFIEVEQYLFKQGYYDGQLTDPTIALSPVVELLSQQPTGQLSAADAGAQIDALKKHDLRNDFDKYIYRQAVSQQYALALKGGAEKSSWIASTGYDKDISNLAAGYNRFNLRFQNNYRPLKNLDLNAGIYYTQSENKSGKPGYGQVFNKSPGSFYPYMQLADANGNPLPVAKDYELNYAKTTGNGLLENWLYYPLEDFNHTPATSANTDATINIDAAYTILKGLTADIKYQYERQSTNGRNLFDQDSYSARNYVNKYTQIDDQGNVTNSIPKGGILDLSNQVLTSQQLRGQLNFDRTWGKSDLSAIAGAELRNAATNSNVNRLYGYNGDLSIFQNVDYSNQYPNYVNGNDDFIPGNTDVNKTQTRYVSEFANIAYAFAGKYTASLSGRRDASNLFGVNINNDWNPFWSAGASWNISDEAFYRVAMLPFLKLRITYGSSGNIDPGMVAATTIAYSGTNPFTKTPFAYFQNYFNPDLKWETSKMLNIGLDFRSKANRVSGSLEYYQKKGSDLFGTALLDYTGGITSQVIKNAADMKGNGIDLELHSMNFTGAFRWSTTLNFSIYHDQVTQYHLSSLQGSNFITGNTNVTISGLPGKPVYSVFAYRSAGLDPNTGDPRGYLNGQLSEDYTALTGTGTTVSNLKYFGSALPTKFGSFINNFNYLNFGLDIGIIYKLAYYFRRNSINYSNLYEFWQGDPDYAKRWQKPGDELKTSVPSMVYPEDNNRDNFYSGSDVLVDRGDQIRLQFINLSYDFSKWLNRSQPFKGLQVYFNASNLGLIWAANKDHIDPDYYNSLYSTKPPKTFTIGCRANF